MKLRQKREEVGINVANLAHIIGRHRSYEEVESGHIPLVWEENGKQIWSNLIEPQLAQGKVGRYPKSSKRLPASVPTAISWTKSGNCARSGKLSNK